MRGSDWWQPGRFKRLATQITGARFPTVREEKYKNGQEENYSEARENGNEGIGVN